MNCQCKNLLSDESPYTFVRKNERAMKRNLIKVTVLGMLLAGGIYFMEETKTLPDVALDNIEALAAGEGSSMWFCRGSGSLDCPSGNKVAYIVDNYSLD